MCFILLYVYKKWIGVYGSLLLRGVTVWPRFVSIFTRDPNNELISYTWSIFENEDICFRGNSFYLTIMHYVFGPANALGFRYKYALDWTFRKQYCFVFSNAMNVHSAFRINQIKSKQILVRVLYSIDSLFGQMCATRGTRKVHFIWNRSLKKNIFNIRN